MLQTSKIGTLLASVGAIGGAIYAVKNQKPTTTLVLMTIGFGIGGYMLGNSINKFYTT